MKYEKPRIRKIEIPDPCFECDSRGGLRCTDWTVIGWGPQRIPCDEAVKTCAGPVIQKEGYRR